MSFKDRIYFPHPSPTTKQPYYAFSLQFCIEFSLHRMTCSPSFGFNKPCYYYEPIWLKDERRGYIISIITTYI